MFTRSGHSSGCGARAETAEEGDRHTVGVQADAGEHAKLARKLHLLETNAADDARKLAELSRALEEANEQAMLLRGAKMDENKQFLKLLGKLILLHPKTHGRDDFKPYIDECVRYFDVDYVVSEGEVDAYSLADVLFDGFEYCLEECLELRAKAAAASARRGRGR